MKIKLPVVDAFANVYKYMLLISLRNVRSMVFGMISPLVITLMFIMVGNPSMLIHVNIGLVGNAQSVGYKYLYKSFNSSPMVKVIKEPSRDNAVAMVKSGKLDALVIAPQTISLTNTNDIRTMFSNSNVIMGDVSRGVVEGIINNLNASLVHAKTLLVVKSNAMQGPAKDIMSNYTNFLIPGILALMILSNSVLGFATTFVKWKEKGILRRLIITPVSETVFISASVINQAVINTAIISIVALIIVFGFGIKEHFGPLAVLILFLGNAVMLSVGALVGSIAKNHETLSPVENLIILPLLVLGGTFFPVSVYPMFIQYIALSTPFAMMVLALRSVMVSGAGLFSMNVGLPLVGVVFWILALQIISVKIWRSELKPIRSRSDH